MKISPNTVDEYIASFPVQVLERLERLRTLVIDLGPEITEGISYGMPAYKFKNKPLFYFAAFPKHIGIYALPASHKAFESSLGPYKKGKGSFQIPHSKTLPLELIRKMIEFNMNAMI